MDNQKSSTGLDHNVAGLLCYLLGWVTGLIFFFMEKDSKFVKFHAMQSIIVFGALTVLHVVVIIMGIIFSLIFGGWISVIISTLIWIVGLLLWIAWIGLLILLMVKAYQGETFKLPFVGDIAEKQAR